MTTAAVAVICGLTLFPTSGQPDTPMFCVPCGERSLLDAILNVGLFLPLGVGLALMGQRLTRAGLTGFAVSVLVEVLQYVAIPGRDSTLRDVLSNTTGTLLGAMIGLHLAELIQPPPRLARRLLVVASASWLLAHAIGDWLVHPSFTARRVFSAPSIDTRSHETFTGKLLAASLNGRSFTLTVERLTPEELAKAQGRDAHLTIRALVIPRADETTRKAPLLMLVQPPEEIQVDFGQLGSSLALSVRSRASGLHLRPLSFELDRAFPGRVGAIGVTGQPLSLEADVRPGRVLMSASSEGRSRSETIRVGPALPWAYLLPIELPVGPATSVLAVLWLFATLLPIGYWASYVTAGDRESGRTRFVMALGLVVPGIALAAFPPLFGVAYGSLWEWVGALAGLLAGFTRVPLALVLRRRAAFRDDSARELRGLRGIRAPGGVLGSGSRRDPLPDRLDHQDAPDQSLQ